jgi:hypothetical protein
VSEYDGVETPSDHASASDSHSDSDADAAVATAGRRAGTRRRGTGNPLIRPSLAGLPNLPLGSSW